MNDWTQVLSAIANLFAAGIASGALIWSFMTYRRSASISHYGELDRMYADLLSLAVEKPHLRRGPAAKRNDDQKDEYHTYAYMVWNFIEAVCDRIYNNDSDETLRKTWEAVISVEHQLFGAWFNDNAVMFKNTFKPFIDNKLIELKKIPAQTGVPRNAQ